MKKKPDVQKLKGISIYKDAKGHVIYSPWFTKDGYILHDENVSEFQNYGTSYLIAIIVLLVIFYFTKSLGYAFILSLGYLAVSIFMFYTRCIKKVPKIENFNKPKKDNYIIRQAKSITSKRIIVVILACIFMSVYIIFNSLYFKYTGTELLVSYIFAIASLLFGLLYVVILIVKKKNNYIDE